MYAITQTHSCDNQNKKIKIPTFIYNKGRKKDKMERWNTFIVHDIGNEVKFLKSTEQKRKKNHDVIPMKKAHWEFYPRWIYFLFSPRFSSSSFFFLFTRLHRKLIHLAGNNAQHGQVLHSKLDDFYRLQNSWENCKWMNKNLF